MTNLFEYQNKEDFLEAFQGLEAFLDEIWNKREQYSFYQTTEENKVESQRFIQFLRNTNKLKSNKYVGVIHYNGHRINLLPKIFYKKEKEYSSNEIAQIQNHILWWLSYCRKIKFPNYQATISSIKSDFFEILIYLFSKYTKELLNNSIYQQYEEVNRELSFIKGRLNTNEYIKQNLSKGRWHKLNCTFDSFVFDNKFNRIVKFVANMLFRVTKVEDNKKNLREILFILDEVTDEVATPEECAQISFNPMFGDFETVKDYCYLFLKNSVSFDYKNELKLFAFLLPMEYLFEDFIFGFINKEIEEIEAKSQKSNTYLDVDKLFKLKPDLFLKINNQSIIADAKYKIVHSDSNDPKKGISQSDLYQMIAYAIRFKVDQIKLFYPNTIETSKQEFNHLSIQDTWANEKEIQISTHQLPILNTELLEKPLKENIELGELFQTTKNQLKTTISSIFKINDSL